MVCSVKSFIYLEISLHKYNTFLEITKIRTLFAIRYKLFIFYVFYQKSKNSLFFTFLTLYLGNFYKNINYKNPTKNQLRKWQQS